MGPRGRHTAFLILHIAANPQQTFGGMGQARQVGRDPRLGVRPRAGEKQIWAHRSHVSCAVTSPYSISPQVSSGWTAASLGAHSPLIGRARGQVAGTWSDTRYFSSWRSLVLEK